jgi:hypothetical protein
MTKSSKTSIGKAAGPKPSHKARRRGDNKPKQKIAKTQAKPANRKPAVRETSKLATVIAMLRRHNGASIEDLCKATGWQAHSVRGALSGAIKKKLRLTVTSQKSDGVRFYRVTN